MWNEVVIAVIQIFLIVFKVDKNGHKKKTIYRVIVFSKSVKKKKLLSQFRNLE
jgi:hypothetical protein